MVAEVIETPTETPVDPSTVETQTETPPTPDVEERAAETPPEDAAPQLEITAPDPPTGMSRLEAEAFFEEKAAALRADAAAQALESDRRRRQTENARRAKQEADDVSSRQEAVDTLRAALGAKGIYEVPDEAAFTAIDRIASKKAERLSANSFDTVEQAWDYLTAPAYGKSVDLDDSFEPAARRLGPKLQHLVDQIRPAIEAKAREGYIAESELPKRIEQYNTAKAAKSREGQEELKHVEGSPATSNDGSLANWETRVAHQGEDGYPHLSESDWNEYRSVRRASGL